jgi:hypothetical protein
MIRINVLIRFEFYDDPVIYDEVRDKMADRLIVILDHNLEFPGISNPCGSKFNGQRP